MTIIVGVIAEDDSDVDVIEMIIKKYRRSRAIKFHRFAPGGCGKIRAKCRAWGLNLAKRGCSRLVVVHDSDEWDPRLLQQDIVTALHPPPIALQAVVIPVRELEAWLLSDASAIKRALNIKGKVNKVQSPEAIRKPKEFLRDLIYRCSKKRKLYVNTIHNAKIASYSDLAQLRRCTSFRALDEFISRHC